LNIRAVTQCLASLTPENPIDHFPNANWKCGKYL